MTYALDESHTSRNYTPNANVQATFGYPRDIKYITIHHWGNNGQQFGVVRDYLCTNTTPTSAHFVAEGGQVACIVAPEDAAWHAGNAQGNAQSIGIECRPEHTDADYQTVGELVAWLRSQYGDLPLVPHNYWTSTACPGDYDLTRIDAIARGQSVSAQAGTITPIQEELVPNPTDPVFISKDGAKVSLQDLLNSIDAKAEAARNEATNAKVNAADAAGRVSFAYANLVPAIPNALVALAQGLGELKNQPTAAAPAIDVPALAAQIAVALNATQAHDFLVAFHNALPAN